MRLQLIFNRYACLLSCLMISFGMYAQLPETEGIGKEEPHCGSDILLNNIATRTFYEAKTVTVKAYVYDLNMLGCDLELTTTINITCPVPKPTFTATPNDLVSLGETVHFQTDESAYQYSWQVDGANKSMGTSFDYLVSRG